MYIYSFIILYVEFYVAHMHTTFCRSFLHFTQDWMVLP